MILKVSLFILVFVCQALSLRLEDLNRSGKIRLEKVLARIDFLDASVEEKGKWREGVIKLLEDSRSNTDFKKKLQKIGEMLNHYNNSHIPKGKRKEAVRVEVDKEELKDADIEIRDSDRLLKMIEEYLRTKQKELSAKDEPVSLEQYDSGIEEDYDSDEEEKEERLVEPPIPKPTRKKIHKRRRRRRKRGKKGRKFKLFDNELNNETKFVNEESEKNKPTPSLEEFPHVEALSEALADKPREEKEEDDDLWKYLPFHDDNEPEKEELKAAEEEKEVKKEPIPILIADELKDSFLLRNNDIDEKLRKSDVSTCLIDLYVDMLNSYVELILKKEQSSLANLEKFRKIQIETINMPMNDDQLKKQIHLLNNLYRESLSASFSRLGDLKKCPKTKRLRKHSSKKSDDKLDNLSISTCKKLKQRANNKELFGNFTSKFVKKIQVFCEKEKKEDEYTEEERKTFSELRNLLEGAEKRRDIFAQNNITDSDFIEKMNLLKGEIEGLLKQIETKNPCSDYYNMKYDNLMIQWYGTGDKNQLKVTTQKYQDLHWEVNWFMKVINNKSTKHK